MAPTGPEQLLGAGGGQSLVREKGLEPSRPKTLEPKSSASANSATRASVARTAAPKTIALWKALGHLWFWQRGRDAVRLDASETKNVGGV